MDKHITQLIIIAVCMQTISSVNYTLIAPKKVVVGNIYSALLTINYDAPKDVTMELLMHSSETAVLAKTVSVSGSDSVNEITLELPDDLIPQPYKCRVTNDIINAEIAVNVVKSPLAVFIQTDKPIYKPSDTVRVRVAVIDENLRPVDGPITVSVQDAASTTLKQWRDHQLELGLAQFELPLSDRPPLGTWTISATYLDLMSVTDVRVKEYVLPKFEVKFEAPSYILSTDASLEVKVSAMYTYGEPVIGTVTLYVTDYLGYTYYKLPIKYDINGEKEINIDTSYLQRAISEESLFTLYAVVYEPLSDNSLNASAEVYVSRYQYEVEFMKGNSKYYQPGGTANYYFDVSKPDGSRISGENLKLRVVAAETPQVSIIPTILFDKTVDVPPDGITTLTIQHSANYRNKINIDVTIIKKGGTVVGPFLGMTVLENFSTLNNDQLFQITSLSADQLKIGDTLKLDVASSDEAGKYQYVVLSKGKILQTGSESITNHVTLTIAQDHYPSFTVLAYKIIKNELLADAMTFSIDGDLNNQISVAFVDESGKQVSESKPGAKVKVKVSTEPGSMVGLLSIDKSITLLAGRYDNKISLTQIRMHLLSLSDTVTTCGLFWPVIADASQPYKWGDTTVAVFETSGLSFSTDADYFPCPEYDSITTNNHSAQAMPGLGWNAGNGGFAANSAASSERKTSKPRSVFPETWLWSLQMSDNSELFIEETVPDTITSWTTSALSMHPTKGLTVTKQSAELKVKLPFFITPVLPYSAVLGEELKLRVIATNYGVTDDSCTVTVESSEQYELKVDAEDSYKGDSVSEVVNLPVNKGKAVELWIKPLAIDTIELKANAQCKSGAQDSFIKQLKVKAAGYPVSKCLTAIVKLDSDLTSVSETYDIALPAEATPSSQVVTVMITGDVMSQSIKDVPFLILLPLGCGEQNMAIFSPNIFITRYLLTLNKLTSDIRVNSERYLSFGYQKELTYRHDDGSFSAFGKSDPAGSTWLTAFVIKSFRQAQQFIYIDKNVITAGVDYLNSVKVKDGSFEEKGRVIHTEMQGGSNSGVTLAALVVIAMLEDVEEPERSNLRTSLQTTREYLENQYTDISKSPYKLSVVAYALQLAGSTKVDRFLNALEAMQQQEGDKVWWTLSAEANKVDSSVLGRYIPDQPAPSGVEMASYAVLTYLARDDLDKAGPVAQWLIANRGVDGGYMSTQDTILGLQALSTYGQATASAETNVEVKVNTDTGMSLSYTVNKDNAIITERKFLKPTAGRDIKSVSIEASGVGSAFVTICSGFNLMTKPVQTNIAVETRILTDSNTQRYILDACTRYLGEGESGMGLTQAYMPTGFSPVTDNITVTSGDVARIETSSSGGVNVYWNDLQTDSCIRIPLLKSADVLEVKDSYVSGSLYYDTDSTSKSFYNPLTAVDGGSGCLSKLSLWLALSVISTFLITM